jgi:hypothetical protein
MIDIFTLRANAWHSFVPLRAFSLIAAMLSAGFITGQTRAQTQNSSACRIESTNFDGWRAEELSNPWVRVTIVPQLGGRVMQVTFAGHPYLFVNPKYKGQYIPPESEAAKGRWINYGGDKIWPMPEGSQDDQHWAGPTSDALDDGDYSFKILSRDSICTIRLDGPPDAKTGLQYSREISIDGNSPQISFHAIMKNIASHPIRWSIQSVTQYNTAETGSAGRFNLEFWAFTPANQRSVYLNQYHVRSGLADDPSFSVKNDLFTLHWLNLQNEVWLDSPGGWLAVVDGSAHFAMVERFHYFEGAEYPGKATVIFYKNGPSLELDDKGMPHITSSNPDETPHYMEAEINSPMVRLQPGEIYALDTNWSPTRTGKEFKTVTNAGVVGSPLVASSTSGGIVLNGTFGVFVPGKLEAQLFDNHGELITKIALQSVSPSEIVELKTEVKAPAQTARVSLHVLDQEGKDQGALGEAQVSAADRSS